MGVVRGKKHCGSLPRTKKTRMQLQQFFTGLLLLDAAFDQVGLPQKDTILKCKPFSSASSERLLIPLEIVCTKKSCAIGFKLQTKKGLLIPGIFGNFYCCQAASPKDAELGT